MLFKKKASIQVYLDGGVSFVTAHTPEFIIAVYYFANALQAEGMSIVPAITFVKKRLGCSMIEAKKFIGSDQTFMRGAPDEPEEVNKRGLSFKGLKDLIQVRDELIKAYPSTSTEEGNLLSKVIGKLNIVINKIEVTG